MITSGYITQCGPWMPLLKEGEKVYTFTSEELSALLRRAYADGYQCAKEIYDMPITTSASTSMWDAVKETAHGTN